MLGLFIKPPWPTFYSQGLKTWEIRKYPTDYRGDILLIDSFTNLVVCKMSLIDCIPLTKERWEMNYEKHRTTSSYESLPYRDTKSPGYAWVLSNPIKYDQSIFVSRKDKTPYIELDNTLTEGLSTFPITIHTERLACKFLGDTMLIYWLKKNYFALVAITNLLTNTTSIISSEINPKEYDLIIRELTPR